MTLELSELSYESIIDEYASKRKDALIPNSKPIHARYIIYKLFGLARNSVRLYTGNLIREHVSEEGEKIEIYGWDKVISAAIRFLKGDDQARLKILLEEKTDLRDHPLINAISKVGLDEQLELRVLKKTPEIEEKAAHHFMTAEDSAFRVELDHDGVKAVANFNDKETTSLLNSFFDSVFASKEFSEPLAV